jgi:hypothetical protein
VVKTIDILPQINGEFTINKEKKEITESMTSPILSGRLSMTKRKAMYEIIKITPAIIPKSVSLPRILESGE